MAPPSNCHTFYTPFKLKREIIRYSIHPKPVYAWKHTCTYIIFFPESQPTHTTLSYRARTIIFSGSGRPSCMLLVTGYVCMTGSGSVFGFPWLSIGRILYTLKEHWRLGLIVEIIYHLEWNMYIVYHRYRYVKCIWRAYERAQWNVLSKTRWLAWTGNMWPGVCIVL